MRKSHLSAFVIPYLILISVLFCNCTDFKSATPLVDEVNKSSERYSEHPSSTDITCMTLDREGRLWIGTSEGLCQYDGVRYHLYYHNEADSTSLLNNSINSLCVDNEGRLWIATQAGLTMQEPDGTFRDVGHFARPIRQVTQLSDGRILVHGDNLTKMFDNRTLMTIDSEPLPVGVQSSRTAADDNGGFWFCTPTSLTHVDRSGHTIQQYQDSASNAKLVLSLTVGDTLWVAQARRIKALNLNTGQLLYDTQHWLDFLPSLLYYESGHLYMKSYRHGVKCLDTKTFNIVEPTVDRAFIAKMLTRASHIINIGNQQYVAGGIGVGGIKSFDASMPDFIRHPLCQVLSDRNIMAMDVNRKNVVMCCDGRSFYVYLPHERHIIKANQDSLIDDTYYHHDVEKIVADPVSDNKFWIKTKVRTILTEVSGGKIHLLRNLAPSRIITDIAVDEEGFCYSSIQPTEIHISSPLTGNTCDTLRLYSPDYSYNSRITSIGHRRLLICTQSLKLIEVDLAQKEVHNLNVNYQDLHSGCMPNCTYWDGARLWIGTSSQGLFCYDSVTQQMRHISQTANSQILDIKPYHQDQLLIASEDGLFGYDKQQDQLTSLLQSDVWQTSHNGLNWLDDTLLYATNQGCRMLMPHSLQQSAIAQLIINPIRVTDEDTQWYKPVHTSDNTYVFTHLHNDLSFSFGSLKAATTERIDFEFMLEGFDNNWRKVRSSSDFSPYYPNLPAGEYKFRVRVSESNGDKQILDEKSMRVIIKRNPWFSIPARLLYIALFIFAIISIYRIRFRIRAERLQRLVAQKDQLREQHINQMNMNFFANISHEFRNPLTIIAGPTTTLLQDPGLSPSSLRKVNTIATSVNRMLKLIDQMLDFNQLEQDALRLKVAHCDINHEVKRWLDPIEETLSIKQITLEKRLLNEPCLMWLDVDKLDKILSNLLTNALKYTPTGGLIRISLEVVDQSQIACSIYNNGSHIPEEYIKDVFKRYYQANRDSGLSLRSYGWGTGIGLYYVQRLVKLHKGIITVNNIKEGGVEFRFTLPLDESVYSESMRVDYSGLHAMQIPVIPKNSNVADQRIQSLNDEINEKTARKTLLIIDDDIYVGNYVKTLFDEKFCIQIRYSAEEALRDLDEIQPDLIISDVIMGKMDGFELCRHIKEDMQYCHIPVLLLTAKSDVPEQVEGLKCGANAYVPKPFQPAYLEALVDSIMRNRMLMQQHLNNATQVEGTANDDLSPLDKQFLDQLYQLMKQHLADDNLNIDTLCHDLLISRSKLSYKVKALTGESPGSFFKKYKLNEAARLLREGKYNISEVATLTGFATASHFSVSFKKQFGIAPSELK